MQINFTNLFLLFLLFYKGFDWLEPEKDSKKSLFTLARDQHYVTLFSSDVVFEGLGFLEADHSALPLFQALRRLVS